MSTQSKMEGNPLGISPFFKVVGVIILGVLFVIGLTTGIEALQRSTRSVELTGEVVNKQQLSPGGGSTATYTVSVDGGQYNVRGTARTYEVGDIVTFWAAPGETEGDFSQALPFDAVRGFSYALGAVAVAVFYWFYSKRHKRKLQ